MNYRKASTKDIKELVRIRLEYLKDDYGVLSEKQIKELSCSLPVYYKNHLGKDIIIYVAEDRERIVSSAFLLIVEKPANPSFITGKTGDVLNVYTDPEYRRKGIAGNLIGMLLKDSKEMNLAYVELKATEMGKSLYKKMGFKLEKSKYTLMKYNVIHNFD